MNDDRHKMSVFSTCLIMMIMICCVGGVGTTALLSMIEIEPPERGLGVFAQGAIEALFFAVPIITFMLIVGMILIGIGVWFFYQEEQERK